MATLLEGHEKDYAWTQIWHLQEANKSPEFAGLSKAKRDELHLFFLDILEQNRELPPPVNGDDPKPPGTNRDPDLWDPADFPRLDDEPDLWIDWAKDATSGAKRGQYRNGHPEGLVWHWTAGHRNGLKEGNALMRDTGMLYLLGDKDGNIAQSDSLKYWGYHGGDSSWTGIPGTVSNELIGLELQAAGTLTRSGSSWKSWFGSTIPDDEVNQVSSRRENIRAGAYHIYTPAQIWAGRKVCTWLYLNNPQVFKVDNIVGHDEVSPGRKVDPGGSILSDSGQTLSMPDLRRLIANDIDWTLEQQKNL